MDEQLDRQLNTSAAFSPREFILKYLKYLPWLILSALVLLFLAWIKLRYSTDIYEIRSKLLIKSENSFAGKEKFASLFMTDQSQNLNDEVEILKSTGLSKRIVRTLGLQTSYFSQGNIKSHALHPFESPFWLEIMQIKDSSAQFALEVNYINDNTVTLNDDPKPFYFGQTIEHNFVKFRLLKRPVNYTAFESNLFRVTWRPQEEVAAEIADAFKIESVNDFSNVLLISYETENPKLGKDIVNQLMQEYNVSSVEDKRTITVCTLDFIEQNLDTLKRELGAVEQTLQNYQEQNRAIDLEQQAVISFNELSTANQTLTNQEVQLKILTYLTDYLANEKNANKTVPVSMGIAEPSLQVLINEYNNAQLQRETLLQSTMEANQMVKDLDATLRKLRQQIRENLNNIRQSYIITRNDLITKARQAETEIAAVPGKGRRMLEITRQQKILEELYSFLLQKKLETSISSASTISNSKVVEPAKPLPIPVKPERRSLYMIAIALGLGIPISIIAIKEYLNDKITSRFEVEKLTQLPIIGEVGHSDEANTLVVTKNNRKVISEQFRIIRTNFQYILTKIERPVILVTSSFSGEGKSFICTNIGAVMALAGKKTVILEFDIRKPKIIAGLNLSHKFGITNFIIGNATIPEIIIPLPKVENLDIIPCGPIPPNPGELLLNEKVKELFTYLRLHYDTIIVDSAPVGLVSDAILLGAYADATLYIMRQNYTFKKQVNLINDLHNEDKLPKLSLLLNDVQNKGGYGGYYGTYGYGYSYGQSAEYFEDEGKKKKGVLARVKGWFS